MNRIVTHLWFNRVVREAAEFYISVFGGDSKIDIVRTIPDTPSGPVETVTFSVWGFPFMGIGAGPEFKFNPSVSFHVICQTTSEVDALWEKLIGGGKALMELGEYPFSKRYGWLMDRYGVSWQIIFASEDIDPKQRIKPVLLFTGDVYGKVTEAIDFYTSVFNRSPLATVGESKVYNISRYGKGHEPDREDAVMYSDFSLLGIRFGAMESAHEHKFSFNESVSFMVVCRTQQEMDYFWEHLSAVPDAEQCGWLKDKYGVSWQIVPEELESLMADADPERNRRVTKALLAMKKLDIAILKQAYEGGV